MGGDTLTRNYLASGGTNQNSEAWTNQIMCFEAQTPLGCDKFQARLALAKAFHAAVSKGGRADGDDPARAKALCKCCMYQYKRVNNCCFNEYNFVAM